MPILLDHLIVPSLAPVESAKNLAEILGVECGLDGGHFTPVYVNDTLTLEFAKRAEGFNSHHYCFHVSEEEFDPILSCIIKADITYRSTPTGDNDNKLNTRYGGRNFYWNDSDGHVWEVLTVSYARKNE